MSDDQIELAWIEEGKKTDTGGEFVHLAIIQGNVRVEDNGRGGATIYSDENFTVCGVKIPFDETMYPTDMKDVNCSPCLDARYGPHIEEFIKKALEEPSVAS